MTAERSAAGAYDHWASAYDECNAANDYEIWLGEVLLPCLEGFGLERGWALDIGCGTGRAFAPLLKRGWQIVGCDVSAGMLEAARQKFGRKVRLFQCDARDLSRLQLPAEAQKFSLVLMLNDVANYLLDVEDLRQLFAGVAEHLDHGTGLAVFDVNALSLFERDYGSVSWERLGGTGWEWRGITSGRSDGIYRGELRDPKGFTTTHVQRYWSQTEIEEMLRAAGLRCLAVYGQHEGSNGIRLSPDSSQSGSSKIVYFVCHESKTETTMLEITPPMEV